MSSATRVTATMVTATKVVVSPDGSITFKQLFDNRFAGAVLLLLAIGGTVILAKVYGGPFDRPASKIVLYKNIAIPCVLLFLLSGLYLVSRWKCIRICRHELAVESGWLLWRRQKRHAVADFAGLEVVYKFTHTQNAWTGAMTVVGVASLAAFGVGFTMSKNAPVYCLRLVRQKSSRKGILFFSTLDAQEMNQMLKTLSDGWALNLVQ